MTIPNHTASTAAELPIKIQLGSQITALRPAATTERGPDWVELDDDTLIGLTDRCDLRVRLLAYGDHDEPLADPAWIVRAATRTEGGHWRPLSDFSAAEGDYLTAAHPLRHETRTYRFHVGLQGTALSSTFEVTVDRTDPRADDDDDDDHDIIFDPDGDLKPKPTPTTGTSASLNNGLSALG